MLKVILFFVLVGLAAFGVNWIADRPGEVAITWNGWRIETSVMVSIIALAIFGVAVTLLWSILRAILRSPRTAMHSWQRRRGRLGYHAISRGLIAIGAGDARAAKKHAKDAQKYVPREPLALLLDAQTAQLSGDRTGAERSFRAMAVRDDTKLLGLRGLFIEAQRRNDATSARLYAEEAARSSPLAAWAGQAVLHFRCAVQDWEGALDILTRNRDVGALDRKAYQRQRAVLLTAQAAHADTDRDRARELALEAAGLAPDLVPAVAAASRFLSEGDDVRKATRMIEKAWRSHPHPDLADAYANLRLADSARERLARVQRLAALAPQHIESALAVAAAAIGAREFSIARQALDSFAEPPTQRVALMMAKIEELDRGDEGRAREWMRRAVSAERDPTWTADGFVSDRWMPMSPVTGRLDAFEWRVPLAEIERRPQTEAIDNTVIVAEPVSPPAVELPDLSQAETPAADSGDTAPPVTSASVLPTLAEPQPKPEAAIVKPRAVEPVIPLVHVPDDPGPEPDHEADPKPESTANPAWRRLFGQE